MTKLKKTTKKNKKKTGFYIEDRLITFINVLHIKGTTFNLHDLRVLDLALFEARLSHQRRLLIPEDLSTTTNDMMIHFKTQRVALSRRSMPFIGYYRRILGILGLNRLIAMSQRGGWLIREAFYKVNYSLTMFKWALIRLIIFCQNGGFTVGWCSPMLTL